MKSLRANLARGKSPTEKNPVTVVNSIPGWLAGCHTSTPKSETLGALSGMSRNDATREYENRASLIRLPRKALLTASTAF